jgi:hypothetical protein
MSKQKINNWQAENDAYTLAQYQEIISDKKRLNAATKAAQKQANDLTKRLDSLKKITKKNG